jgi:hypothetical protein
MATLGWRTGWEKQVRNEKNGNANGPGQSFRAFNFFPACFLFPGTDPVFIAINHLLFSKRFAHHRVT